ncbi:MAG: aldo/keto reductase [Firmicutes bacterium]|nr:aldo/keto reductase [Bacillota bacterium]
MQYRKLGRTNLDVSFIGLGGLYFPALSNVEAVKIIMKANELGINLIELGRAYVNSEEKAGFVMQKKRNEFCIATKTPQRKKEGAMRDIDASLTSLKTDYIDVYQLHQIDSLEMLDRVLEPDGACEALKRAKEQGKIRYTGITGHSPTVLTKAIKTGEFDTVQVLFNIVEREALSELIPLAQEMNIGILGMKPFGGGAFLEKDSSIFAVLNKYTGTVTRTLLRFVLSFNISSILAGVKTIEELEANITFKETFKPFSDQEIVNIISEIDSLGLEREKFCHRCGYCLCCPQHIDIPLILRLDEYLHKYGSTGWPVQQYSHIRQNALKCVQCGHCEERCPFKLPIREMLKAAHKRLSSISAYNGSQ